MRTKCEAFSQRETPLKQHRFTCRVQSSPWQHQHHHHHDCHCHAKATSVERAVHWKAHQFRSRLMHFRSTNLARNSNFEIRVEFHSLGKFPGGSSKRFDVWHSAHLSFRCFPSKHRSIIFASFQSGKRCNYFADSIWRIFIHFPRSSAICIHSF